MWFPFSGSHTCPFLAQGVWLVLVPLIWMEVPSKSESHGCCAPFKYQPSMKHEHTGFVSPNGIDCAFDLRLITPWGWYSLSQLRTPERDEHIFLKQPSWMTHQKGVKFPPNLGPGLCILDLPHYSDIVDIICLQNLTNIGAPNFWVSHAHTKFQTFKRSAQDRTKNLSSSSTQPTHGLSWCSTCALRFHFHICLCFQTAGCWSSTNRDAVHVWCNENIGLATHAQWLWHLDDILCFPNVKCTGNWKLYRFLLQGGSHKIYKQMKGQQSQEQHQHVFIAKSSSTSC